MFKSKKKRLLQKAKAEALATAMAKTTDIPITNHTEHLIHTENNSPNSVMKAMPYCKKEQDHQKQLKYSLLLDDIPLHDFRSSVILPQLNDQLNTTSCTSPPLSPPPSTKSPDYNNSRSSDSSYESVDGTKHYKDLMAWRHQRNQHRYSNGLFGGKQRNRPKPRPLRTTTVSIKRAASSRRRSHHSTESQRHSSASFNTDVEDEEAAEEQKELSLSAQRKGQYTEDEDEDNEEDDEENAQALSDTSIITPPASTTTEIRDTLTKALEFENSEEEAFFDDLPASVAEDEESKKGEQYELDSDMEENYFFQDFSTSSTANNGTSPMDKKAKRQSRTVNSSKRATKAMSRFDLSSFAKDLHDNRLSVIQQRHTMLCETTEEDELELEKLMQMQKDRLSYMNVKKRSTESLTREISQLPPVPALINEQCQKLKQQQKQSQNEDNKQTKEVQRTEKENEEEKPKKHTPETVSQLQETIEEAENDEEEEVEEEEEEDEEEEAYPANGASDSNKIALDEDIDIPPTFQTKPLTQVSLTALPAISTVDSGKTNKPELVERSLSSTATTPLLPLVRSESSKKKALKAPKKAFKKADIRLVGLIQEENEQIKNATPLSSLNVDTAMNSDEDKDKKKNKKTRKASKKDTKKSSKNANSTATDLATVVSPTSGGIMSRGLFGSLRQVNRSNSKSTPIISSPMAITSHHQQQKIPTAAVSNSNSTLKGLVRNLSTNSTTGNTSSSNSNRSSSSDYHQQQANKSSSNNGISRAAMAVIQHNVSKQEQKNDDETPTDGSKKDDSKTSNNMKSFVNRQRAKSDTSGPPRLISQLMARASSSRKAAPTKVVNMDKEDPHGNSTATRKERAQVVRKTIIYVQPNSLHNLLKNGGEGSTIKLPTSSSSSVCSRQPTLSSPLSRHDTVVSSDSSTHSSDDQPQQQLHQYLTATKVNRQASVKKRVVDTRKDADEMSIKSSLLHNMSNHLERERSQHHRFQVKSITSDDDEEETRSSKSEDDTSQQYMEGVEFREMSDGSVVWGLVKKQGNRKSFYAPKQQNSQQPLEFEHIEDEDIPDDTATINAHDIPSYKTSSNHDNHTKTDTDIHTFNPPTSLSPPPPIPKRSPRRPPVQPKKDTHATTDIYYSDQVTLPTLLSEMMPATISTTSSITATPTNDRHTPYDDDDMSYYGSRYTNDDDEDQESYLAGNKNKLYFMDNETALSSVDDQLDEMMRILTSQQQNERAVS